MWAPADPLRKREGQPVRLLDGSRGALKKTGLGPAGHQCGPRLGSVRAACSTLLLRGESRSQRLKVSEARDRGGGREGRQARIDRLR